MSTVPIFGTRPHSRTCIRIRLLVCERAIIPDIYLNRIFYVSFPDSSRPPEPQSSAPVQCRPLRYSENVLLLETQEMQWSVSSNLFLFLSKWKFTWHKIP